MMFQAWAMLANSRTRMQTWAVKELANTFGSRGRTARSARKPGHARSVGLKDLDMAHHHPKRPLGRTMITTR
jgi:hypothetical protein